MARGNIDLLTLVAEVCGAAIAIVAMRLVFLSEDAFSCLPFHWMWWPAIGGIVIGIGGLIQPRALGVGHGVINALLTGHAALSLIIGILIVKTAIWPLSLGSGTSGATPCDMRRMSSPNRAVDRWAWCHLTAPSWVTWLGRIYSPLGCTTSMKKPCAPDTLLAFPVAHPVLATRYRSHRNDVARPPNTAKSLSR